MLRRWIRVGATLGAAAGTLFALAVVSFADCSGPNCMQERVVGVLTHAGLGALLGAALGALGALVRSLFRRMI